MNYLTLKPYVGHQNNISMSNSSDVLTLYIPWRPFRRIITLDGIVQKKTLEMIVTRYWKV